MHLFTAHKINRHNNQAVIEQQHIARFDFTRQLFVVQAYAIDVAGFGAGAIQYKFLAGLQHDLAFGKLGNTDFGALQIGHDGHFHTGAFGGLTDHHGTVNMVLCLAVAEVQPHHIDTGSDQLFQYFGGIGSRA